MCSISKRIGDVRLSDFKALFDRPGFFRYHFKAVDQEFGMVKEEVSSNIIETTNDNILGNCITWMRTDLLIVY